MAKRVLVTGGSISAATLAYWLSEGGFDVTVVEAAPSFREGGQSIDVRGAGRTVLERMGVASKVDDSGTGETAWTFVTETGRTAAAFRLADVGGEGPTAKLEILRGDLARILLDAVRDRADIRYGDTVTAVADDPTGAVHVTFSSGREEAFDLFIAAEGVGSSTRELVFPGENDPRWMDMTVGYFTIPKGEDDGTDAQWFNAPGGRCVFLRPDPHGGTTAVLMLREEAREPESKSTEEAKGWLREVFTDSGWQTPRVLAGLDRADDLYFQVLRQVRMPRWSAGRVALTGDAAWCATPISGIGTTLAVVGAYVLAGELAKSPDHVRAFAEYERRMRPFVDQGQGVSKSNQFWTHPRTSLGIATQHAVLGVLSLPVIRDAFLRLGMRNAQEIDLPEYAFATRVHAV